jgi:guanine deaminase
MTGSPPAQPADPAHIDALHLQRAIELSRVAASDGGDLPFGAVVVLSDQVIGEARNETATRSDPTAHAEILALRAAGTRLGRPDLTGAVLYSSSEPCPMCFAACLWARIERVVHAATVDDTAEYGFEDREFYRQVSLPKRERSLHVVGNAWMRDEARDALRRWHGA